MHRMILYIYISTFITGCMSYDGWEKSRDTLIGKEFYPETSLTGVNKKYFVRGPNSKKNIDWSIKEEGGTRYYITYLNPYCKYSILVSEDNVIISWRRESPKKNCYVY